jgi:hypothetical protein
MAVARGMHGSFAIIRGLGYRVYPTAKSTLNACPVIVLASMLWAVSRVASFREVLAQGVNECRALIKVVAAAGNETRPALSAAAKAVLAMEPPR